VQWKDGREKHRRPCCRTSIHTNTPHLQLQPAPYFNPITDKSKQTMSAAYPPVRNPTTRYQTSPAAEDLKAIGKLDWSNSSKKDVRAAEAMAVKKEQNARKHKQRSEYKVNFCRPAPIYLAKVLTGPSSLLQLGTKRKLTGALLSESTWKTQYHPSPNSSPKLPLETSLHQTTRESPHQERRHPLF
jgi:hypothetical protein